MGRQSLCMASAAGNALVFRRLLLHRRSTGRGFGRIDLTERLEKWRPVSIIFCPQKQSVLFRRRLGSSQNPHRCLPSWNCKQRRPSMRIEKYKMLLFAAQHAAPEQRQILYQRAYSTAEAFYGKNSPQVYAVLSALTSHLENQRIFGDSFACREQAKCMFRGS